MDVTIDARGFTLDSRWRDAIAEHAHRVSGLTALEVVIEWRLGPIFGAMPDHFHATARATLDGEAVTSTNVATDPTELVDGLFAQLRSALRRQRWLANGVPTPCTWCGSGTFALVAHHLGELGTDALVCADCGRVEQFVHDVPAVMALEGTVVVHARAKSPYR